MKWRGGVLAAAAFVLAATAVHAAPLELYGRLPTLEDVSISPDGSRIAFVRTTGDLRRIYVVSLTDHKALGAVNVGDKKLRGLDWADDDHLLIRVSTTTVPVGFIGMESEWYGLQVYKIGAKSTVSVPDVHIVKGVDVMNVASGRVMLSHPDGHTVLFLRGMYVTDRTLPALIRVDLDAGYNQRVIRQGSAASRGWVVNDAGEVVAEENYFEGDRRWVIDAKRDGHLTQVAAGSAALDYPELVGFGPEEGTLIVSAIENGDAVWRPLSLQSGQLGLPILGPGPIVGLFVESRNQRVIAGAQIQDLRLKYGFFDPGVEARWQAILRAFPGENVFLVSSSADFSKVVVLVDGTHHGYLYALIDTNSGSTSSIGESYEGLGTPLEVRELTYTAADGLPIPALLTLPAGRAAKSLPLVVFPHGGPAASDLDEFDWWAQAMAAQGYAVLQPNYRGSYLNWKFMSAGFGEWGRKMQTDLSDGVRYLAKEGLVDPARVCIVGASYGGYAALAGVTLEGDVYRCAVSVAGLSDLTRMLKWVNARTALSGRESERYWDRFMGAKGTDDPVLGTLSPLKHIDAVKVPVLLIHGRDDTVVPFEQSQIMYDALKGARKSVQLVDLKQEDHWLSRSQSRLLMLQSTIAFLRANNSPD